MRVEARRGQFREVDRLFSGLSQLLGDWVWPGWVGATLCITRNQSLPGIFWLMVVTLGLLRTVWNSESHLQIFSWGHALGLLGKESRSISTWMVP